MWFLSSGHSVIYIFTIHTHWQNNLNGLWLVCWCHVQLLIFIPEFRESRCSKKVIAYTNTRRIDAQFRWSPPAFIKHSRLIGEFYTVCNKHATGMFFVTFFSFLLFWECAILNRYQIISVFSSNDWNEDSNSSWSYDNQSLSYRHKYFRCTIWRSICKEKKKRKTL